MHADRTRYLDYQRMLIELHAMIAAGTGDSDEAMDLRALMDGPEARLTESEMSQLDALSGDLSMIHGREIPDPEVVARVRASNVPLFLAGAFRDSEWQRVLELLRTDVSSFLKPDQIAYMRSRAHESLEELAAATAFMDEALRRNPHSTRYGALAMELLWKNGRHDEAYLRAKTFLAKPLTPAALVLTAGGILSRLAQEAHPPKDLSIFAQTALERIEQALAGEVSPAIRAAGRVSAGLLAQFLNDDAKAVAAVQAVLNETDDIGHFPVRGMLYRNLELMRAGQSKTPEARELSRELAEAFVPSHDLQPV